MLFSINAITRKKLPSDQDTSEHLRSCLTGFDLFLLGVGAIIGTGIFVLTGIAAATQAGPAVILSFVVSGLACAFAALAYSELAASIGGCGSAYGYSYAAFGELMAWIIGWDLILEYGVAVAAVANGWSGYFNTALTAIGIGLPDYLTKSPENGGIFNVSAASIILILMGFLLVGVKESSRFNAIMVFIKLVTISVFIAVAATHVQPDLWHPFMPFGWFSKSPDGTTTGVLAAASVVFFAYMGFDAVSTAAEEAKNPQKDIPYGILSSLAFCTVIYIVVSLLLTGIVPYTSLNVSSPVAHALLQIGIKWASALVAGGVIAGLTTVMLVLYYGLTRIIFAMSRDGLLPPSLSHVHPKRLTPDRTTIICGLFMAFAAGLLPLKTLAELVNVGTLAAFVLVCAGVIVLRKTRPDMTRPFKIPFGLVIPVLGVISCSALIGFLPLVTHLRFAIWLAVGMVIYVFYSAKKSKLAAIK
ncbi:MAG: amino acid permease [Alphaproteobacteria bacterium]|nr:amino acid permease [Alphaproteobacteria bacterium]